MEFIKMKLPEIDGLINITEKIKEYLAMKQTKEIIETYETCIYCNGTGQCKDTSSTSTYTHCLHCNGMGQKLKERKIITREFEC